MTRDISRLGVSSKDAINNINSEMLNHDEVRNSCSCQGISIKYFSRRRAPRTWIYGLNQPDNVK